jgi:excisionase family DNA binding protein
MQFESVVQRQYFRRTDVARVLGVHPQTVDKLIREGTLSAYKLGHLTVVKREELERFQERLQPVEAAV